jgi:hypothetical protein
MREELKIWLDQDSKWKKNTEDKQELIFREIKEIRKDFSSKQINCENRFTKLESSSKMHGTIFGIIGASFTLVIKWLFTKHL